MGRYVDFYCSNENKELKKIVNPIIMNNFGWLSQKDYDDFYSIAGEVVWDCEKKFNSKKVRTSEFKSFLSSCIQNKVKSRLTYMHRDKRVLKDKDGKPIYDTSIDISISEDEKMTLGDILEDDYDIENTLLEKNNCNFSDKVEMFRNRLSGLQRKITDMIMAGYSSMEIKSYLELTDKQYQDSWKVITSYENKRILYSENINLEDDEMDTAVLTEDLTESYKNTSYSIKSISKQLNKKRIRDDHILQRHSGQWKSFAKSELISDILRGKSLTQIIISEEIKNGLRMQWLIDGKQRCTTLDEYLHDEFAISKNVKNYNIRYQTTKTDEDGNEVLNEDGFTEVEFKECDIRGKKFSQLPEELQDVFEDRQIPVLYNMNCTKKDIADDIARFNRSRPMNKSQNGWLELDECFAEFVENIAKMQFFQPEFKGSSYTRNNCTSGTIRRIIVESIMISDFLNDYIKDFNKMCTFLSDEASDGNFTEFYSLIERLTVVCNEEVSGMFTAKDSFLWFGLFSRFAKLKLDDSKFVDFMIEFSKTLHSKNINGKTYDELNGRSTKDKNVVTEKIKHLETLMYEFLHIDKEDLEEVNLIEFVQENVDINITEEDIEQYEDVLDDLTLNVDNSSRLMDKQNRPSLVAIVAYSFKHDIDLDDWIVKYFENNDSYILNQKENYEIMKENLDKFVKGQVA